MPDAASQRTWKVVDSKTASNLVSPRNVLLRGIPIIGGFLDSLGLAEHRIVVKATDNGEVKTVVSRWAHAEGELLGDGDWKYEVAATTAQDGADRP